jgi:hypothetical protein
MDSLDSDRGKVERPFLSVVAGLTYRDTSQVFNRWLVPTYQTSVRWTGNPRDAEDVTAWTLITEMSRLKLPDLVPAVDERLVETTLEAVGRHWSERYGISPPRCSAIRMTEAAFAGRPPLTFDALTERLAADRRLVIVLRFLRKRSASSIAKQLGVTACASAELVIRALGDVAGRLGLETGQSDLGLVDQVNTFVGDLVARRGPLRFEASPGAWSAMLAATHIQAAIAGNDLPRARFVRSLEGLATASPGAPRL